MLRLWQASLIFYASVWTFTEALRWAVAKYGRQKKGLPPFVVTLALELIGTVQICAPVYDVNFILDEYGLQGVFWEIACLELVNAFSLRDAIADPCVLFFNLYKRRSSDAFTQLPLLLAVQFVGGYSSFFIARQFYALGVSPQHAVFGLRECSADLTVGVLFGSAVEAIGLLAGQLSTHHLEHFSALDRRLATVAIALASGLITVLGIHLTGMYANPIVAWALTFNCGEITPTAHFAVYWLGPFVAYFLTQEWLLKQPQAIKKIN